MKIYGRRVGIDEEKLNFMALRRTAMRMRLDEGENSAGMQAFLDSHGETKSTRYRLKHLPGMEAFGPHPNPSLALTDSRQADSSASPAMLGGGAIKQTDARQNIGLGKRCEVPVRTAKPFKEGEGTKHGYYIRRVDREKVKAVMAENIRGVDEEIRCFQELMRGMLGREDDEGRMMEAYSQAVRRMQELMKANKPAKDSKKAREVEERLAGLDAKMNEEDSMPMSEWYRLRARGLDPNALEGEGTVNEMVATMRVMLRNIHRRAMEEVDGREYLHLVDLYGNGCVRLARMVRTDEDEYARIEKLINDDIDDAIRQVGREFGILPN